MNKKMKNILICVDNIIIFYGFFKILFSGTIVILNMV